MLVSETLSWDRKFALGANSPPYCGNWHPNFENSLKISEIGTLTLSPSFFTPATWRSLVLYRWRKLSPLPLLSQLVDRSRFFCQPPRHVPPNALKYEGVNFLSPLWIKEIGTPKSYFKSNIHALRFLDPARNMKVPDVWHPTRSAHFIAFFIRFRTQGANLMNSPMNFRHWHPVPTFKPLHLMKSSLHRTSPSCRRILRWTYFRAAGP